MSAPSRFFTKVAIKLLSAAGFSIADDANGNLVVTYPNGAQFFFASPGGIFLGAGNNWGVNVGGVPNVSASIKTGGVGYPTILGLNPPPAGTNNGYFPVHLHTFAAGTFNQAVFQPTAGTFAWYLLVGFYNIQSFTNATVTVNANYCDDQGNPQTDPIDIVNGPIGGTGRFYWYGVFPHTFNSSPQNITQSLVVTNNSGTASVQLSGQSVIMKLGNAS